LRWNLRFRRPLDLHLDRLEPELPGYWRYRHAFGLPPAASFVSLGEGNTPLLWDDFSGRMLGLKLESLNPSGSYKDRGSAVLLSFLKSRGVTAAVEDSSGNAGASFAAYAARAQVTGRVYVPESASGPKRQQIEMYGAELMRIPGPRSEAARAVMAEVEQGVPYASHAYLPFGLAGIATIAYEIYEQMGRTVPGTIIAPVGHGGLLLGIVRGFQTLEAAGLIKSQPYYVGVQAAACDPVVRAFHHAGGHGKCSGTAHAGGGGAGQNAGTRQGLDRANSAQQGGIFIHSRDGNSGSLPVAWKTRILCRTNLRAGAGGLRAVESQTQAAGGCRFERNWVKIYSSNVKYILILNTIRTGGAQAT